MSKIIRIISICIVTFIFINNMSVLNADEKNTGSCQNDSLLIHLRKGCIVDNEIKTYKISALFKEFSYVIKDILLLKEYQLDEFEKIKMQVFIITLDKRVTDLQVFCSMLEEQSDIISVEPVYDIERSKMSHD
ncbi:MAG: hypothetical protein KAI43_08970 [Candidatus Aureabacteria bacterium]|nr:hypothetical protein [Candidatus Auribacterota bacterium]